jgi:K+/H+ antiporter YhaU regulatory subunit KhtT
MPTVVNKQYHDGMKLIKHKVKLIKSNVDVDRSSTVIRSWCISHATVLAVIQAAGFLLPRRCGIPI